MKITTTCVFGVEAILKKEIENLGYSVIETNNGRVSFNGDYSAVARSNIFLRTAGRVLIELKTFEARTFDELYDQIIDIPWEEYIDKNGSFPVNVSSLNSTLFSVPTCQSISKKAIVNRLLKKYDTLPEAGAQYKVNIYIHNDMARVYLDTTGVSLHKRGYRTKNYSAPLSETLAAALILLSYWNDKRTLLDPMCGSGTIPIEAAMIAKNIAPGSNREFDSCNWGIINSKIWSNAYDEAYDLEKKETNFEIYGSDISRDAIKLSRFHAKNANVEDIIKFSVCDVKELQKFTESGIIICNPPYGERMMEKMDIPALYKSMNIAFNRFDTWSKYIYSGFDNFENVYGIVANKRRKVFNGKLNCTYYQYFGPKPIKNMKKS